MATKVKTSVWAESIQDFDPARIFQSPVLDLYSERRVTQFSGCVIVLALSLSVLSPSPSSCSLG